MAKMRFHYRISRRICQLVFWTMFRGRAFGVENVPTEGGVLLLSNHQSFLDPMLATLSLPRECNYMARHTLFEKPAFKRLIEAFNAFPVKRGSADIGAIKETLRRLKGGGLVTMFPEATRTEDGSIRAMQPGALLLARKANVPIVPTCIVGAYEAWPRNRKFPRPSKIVISYEKPLFPADLADKSDEDAINLVRDRIVAMFEKHARAPQ